MLVYCHTYLEVGANRSIYQNDQKPNLEAESMGSEHFPDFISFNQALAAREPNKFRTWTA